MTERTEFMNSFFTRCAGTPMERKLADRLLWLRNHYDTCSGKSVTMRRDVLREIDLVLEEFAPFAQSTAEPMVSVTLYRQINLMMQIRSFVGTQRELNEWLAAGWSTTPPNIVHPIVT